MPLDLRSHLLAGQLIPALPLALQKSRRWDETRQRALVRYYVDAGAGGLAVGVHSTQFAIREPKIGLYEPVLRLAAAAATGWLGATPRAFGLIAGLCGRTPQALREAGIAGGLGYHAGLLSLGAWARDPEEAVLKHCRAVARELPLVGFYLQPAVGGRVFSYRFWRKFADIPTLVAVKIAPFNRYRTIDVVRAVLEAGRDDVALYTGNDDNIIGDLLTPFEFAGRTRHIVGGLLGQWGVWTERAVALLEEIKQARKSNALDASWLTRNAALTDANAAIFDSANNFAGCLPGIHEVLRRQGLLATTACLDRHEQLSPGQGREITRVARDYPWLVDDSFVAANRDRWLK
ncbi:MAG: dihydrodipicolinate synthase family protein [Opitutaceae bacterium]|nr:dihydrodipicolinate synthase family protein [Opitutaceae bacterium]